MLDVIVVDMPPGTGDAQLTMAQQVPLRGAVIVSTPQDLALIDARRGVAMFKRVNVPILGIIENRVIFCAPNAGTRSDIFVMAARATRPSGSAFPFLGEVPLHMDFARSPTAAVRWWRPIRTHPTPRFTGDRGAGSRRNCGEWQGRAAHCDGILNSIGG